MEAKYLPRTYSGWICGPQQEGLGLAVDLVFQRAKGLDPRTLFTTQASNHTHMDCFEVPGKSLNVTQKQLSSAFS